MKKMDRTTAQMSFKTFWEQVEQKLAAYSADELRAILRAMAQETAPSGRRTFLDKLNPPAASVRAPEPVMKQDLLADIDDWMDELRAEMEDAEDYEDRHEYGWGEHYDDEDSLGPYAEFVEPLAALLDRAETAFDYGDLTLARAAYQKLLGEALELSDEYGRGVRADDLNVDLNRARTRYLRAVYETELPATRPQVLLEQLLATRSWLSGPRSMLNDLIQFSGQPLPDQDRFLQDWIMFLRQQNGGDIDAWLREAIRLAQGTRGLEELARAEGTKRPRAFLDWLAALQAEQKPREVLTTAEFALQTLPAQLPIRAAIADYLCAAAATCDEQVLLREGRWEAFTAKPSLVRLLDLSEPEADRAARTQLLRQAAQYAKEYLAQPPRHEEMVLGERDGLESAAWVERSLLAHAYLLSQQWNQAQALASQEQVLGWSNSNSAQGLVVPFFLAALSEKQSTVLPVNVALVWQPALENSAGYAFRRLSKENAIFGRLEQVYRDLMVHISLPPDQQEQFLTWCIEIAKRRVSAIVSNQHRGSYDKAALLTAACAEVLQRRGRKQAGDELLNEVRERFPRHRAFQTELKTAVHRMKSNA